MRAVRTMDRSDQCLTQKVEPRDERSCDDLHTFLRLRRRLSTLYDDAKVVNRERDGDEGEGEEVEEEERGWEGK